MRFLIVRLVGLGDVAMATPLVSRIHAEHPGAHVTWLCGEQARGLLELVPGVDDIITVDERAVLRGGVVARTRAILGVWARLARLRFDHVLMLHPDPRYRILTVPVRARRSASASHGPENANPLRGRYRGDEAARLLDGDAWVGPASRQWPLADVRSRLAVPKTASGGGRRRIALVPGGARNVLREDARRRWPLEHYRALAEQLISAGHEVALIGDSADMPFAEAFAPLPVRNRIGAFTLGETLVELRDADVVVSHDTGPMHLTRLVRTPLVALFGPTDPSEFIGEDSAVTVLAGVQPLPCRPCYDGRDYPPCASFICMSSISVEEVRGAVEARLRE